MSNPIQAYGWTARPRDPKLFLGEKAALQNPVPQLVESIRLPGTPLVKRVLDYAKQELNVGTFNHSMRVFYYGDKRSFSVDPSVC